ncbi:MAG: hypothetical protein ACPGJV_04090 [Bacteriovoracaceae bacterium]
MKLNSEKLSILTLIKLDAEAAFERIYKRKKEYLLILSTKRTREHLKDIFRTRFFDIHPSDLKLCSSELQIEADRFYRGMDSMKWYLNSTEDMPQTIEDKMEPLLKEFKGNFDQLMLYLEAETQGEEQFSDPDIPQIENIS